MELFQITDDSLILDGNERKPICICIDASNEVDFNTLTDISNSVKKIANDICQKVEMQMKIEFCIVTYGEECRVIRDFAFLKENEFEDLEIQKIGGAPNLKKALEKCVDLINSRFSFYDVADISSLPAQLFLISSGKTCEEIGEFSNRIISAEKILKVLPFKIGNGSCEILQSLTRSGEVHSDTGEFKKLFEEFKKSAENISGSANEIFKWYELRQEDLDEFDEEEI